VALASKIQKQDVVTLTYIGEGGTSIGDFHEGLNMAAVRKLPMVLVIDNNGYAYSTPTALEYACENLADRAEGYGMPGCVIDGTDVREVYRTCKAAIDRARAGEGPTLIEAKTFRLVGHSQQDGATYVPDSYKEEGKRRDPLLLCEKEWVEQGYCTPEEIEAIKEKCIQVIDDAVDYAEASPYPRPEEALEGVYAE
jgi:TPP-dependent pyruvate/acetoin dehydrogenase alpha subunit